MTTTVICDFYYFAPILSADGKIVMKKTFIIAHFPSLFTDCEIDISIGVDISEPVRSPSATTLKQIIQAFLPQILQQMSIVNNISCTAVTSDDIRFRYQVYTGSSSTLFDSGFESYNDEIFQKFWAVQTTVETYLTVDFLQSFWDRSITDDSANLKVIILLLFYVAGMT